MNKTTRKLKVQESADRYRIGAGKAKSTPSLLLKGQWLAEAGIHAGTHVTVEIVEGFGPQFPYLRILKEESHG